MYTGRYLEASNLATQRDTGGGNVCIWQCHAEHSYLQLTITLLSAVHVLHTLWYSPSIEDNVHVEVSDKVSSKQQVTKQAVASILNKTHVANTFIVLLAYGQTGHCEQ